MKGPFIIVYKDYFGFEHKAWAWAQTADEALRIFEHTHDYPVSEILSVELDDDAIINGCYKLYSFTHA